MFTISEGPGLMINTITSLQLLRSVFNPQEIFSGLAGTEPAPGRILLRYTLWLLLLPPLFSLIGGYTFGWRLGAAQPLVFPVGTLLLISVAYFIVLVFGFVSTAIISRWMASTYGASDALGLHFALVGIVGEPLALASVAHLFPDVFFNVLVMIPAMIWSMYLLYTGIPVVLGIPPERGMLMASSLVGWLLVAAVSLLGLTMGLWVAGVGPALAV
ncbi:MAG: YIP1 family protein [Gammaproteobacteria bacterium]|nr:YIP1 family protein [Gammaproteobacteria bacterium]MDP2347623.1 YIP1 family protein [Gammaproteobacteria bacterium]